MRILRRKIREAHSGSKRQLRERPYILPVLGLVLGFMIVGGVILGGSGQKLRPHDAHVVFLFDKGDKRVIDTKAQTVGELISKLNLDLIPEDVVEPSLDSPIPEDNFRINIYRARPVTVIDNGVKSVTLTAQSSPRVVAQGAGLRLQPEDHATFEEGSLNENVIGEKVVVARATPVLLNLYGAPLTSYTQAKTVKELLSEKHIKLASGETVQPSEDTKISANLPVFVLRKDAKLINEQVDIPAPEQVVNDASLSFGTTVVRQAGSPGRKAVTYILQTDADGKETGRQVIQEAVITEPVPQIVARGSTIDIGGDKTGVMAAAGIAAGDYAYANYIVSRESNWHVTAQNASGAYGLCQSLPGSKMASSGSDWATNPVTQLKWCNGYAARYGGWGGAYNFWVAHHYW